MPATLPVYEYSFHFFPKRFHIYKRYIQPISCQNPKGPWAWGWLQLRFWVLSKQPTFSWKQHT